MPTSSGRTGYLVWAVDNIVYGPVNLSLLIQWIEDERVTASTWIYKQSADAWHKAAELEELLEWFKNLDAAAPTPYPLTTAPESLEQIRTGSLRRIKILATLDEARLEQLRSHLRLTRIRQWQIVLKQGDPADGMYLIIGGEVRVRLLARGAETIVATLGPGEFFGELSLFDQGSRSADVVANTDALLLKLSAGEFQKMAAQEPELAAPFLMAVSKTVAARMRMDNKRYADSLNMARFTAHS